jgi:small subunit ribosomal protein S6
VFQGDDSSLQPKFIGRGNPKGKNMAETAAKAVKIAPSAQTLREYETIYLLKQDLTTEQTDRVKERVRGIVEREGGKVVKFTTWGKKKTAFLVGNKQARAIFVHVSFLGTGRVVSEVERNLRNLEEVIKFQTIKVSDAVLPESRPAEEDVVLEGDREDERPLREDRDERDDRDRGDRGDRFDRRDRGDRDDRGPRAERGGERESDDASNESNDSETETEGD